MSVVQPTPLPSISGRTNLIVNLDLVSGRPFSDNDIPGRLDHGYAVGIQELSVAFPAFSELELEAPFLVKNLRTEERIK